MEDKTIIRIVELLCGLIALVIHTHYGVDTIVIILVCVLWGIPLDIVISKIEKKEGNKQ